MVRISETSSAGCILFGELNRYDCEHIESDKEGTTHAITDGTRSDALGIGSDTEKNYTK